MPLKFTLSAQKYVYDGTTKSLLVNEELPDGINITYIGNNQVEAGSYTISASFSSDSDLIIKDVKAILTISKANYDMSKVSFKKKSFIYDGKQKELLIKGELPENISVEYINNTYTNTGKYSVTAKFIGEEKNYNLIADMNSTILIKKAKYDMSNVSFVSKSFEYDSTEKQIKIKGKLPKGISVSYKNSSGTEVGTYQAIASFSFSSKNYKPIPNMTFRYYFTSTLFIIVIK